MEYKEIIARLGKIPTGDLTDSMRRLGISGYTKGIYCLQGKPIPNMVGPALTVKYIEKQPGQKTDFVGGQFAFARSAHADDGDHSVHDCLTSLFFVGSRRRVGKNGVDRKCA